MKSFKTYILDLVTIAFAFGCQKQGYMPPPEGQPVPYVDTVKLTLKEAIAGSAATYFYAAWQRSNMDAILKAQSAGKTYFTLLLPSNAALESAGYTLQKLQTMEPKDLDSLIMYHTLRNRVTEQDLTIKADNYIAPTILNNPTLMLGAVSGIGGQAAFIYRHQLKLQDNKLYVDGKAAGTGKGTVTKDGQIWFLDKPLIRPTKTITQFIEQDGRFTILQQIMKLNDTRWNQLLQAAEPGATPRGIYPARFGWDVAKTWDNKIIVTETTVFLPTDDAFKAAGFNTVQDLVALDNSRALPYYGATPNGGRNLNGYFATDSLLTYHTFWGKNINLPPFTNYLYNSPVFYSNVMNNNVLANYVILGYVRLTLSSTAPYGTYYMPLDFTRDANGTVKVKHIGSGAPAATVIEADIPVIQGTVNVVDRLLIPKGFKTK